jgi:hypothetical protein
MDHVVKGKEEDEEVKESAETSQRVSQSFRSFREALMTKHFEAHDNSPVGIIK